MEEIEKRHREEEIDEKRKENIRSSPNGYERKAERRNSKIVENVYAPSGWPRFSQDLLSRQHFSLSSVLLVQCMYSHFERTYDTILQNQLYCCYKILLL
ncbi:hypothetical protein E2986_14042 [Frieseomelitta varia]|uniref:Uncharacterized protein n=1 Tax=Frieseomelitta varia TaxID=561572 RepID=A0A833W4G0_9HYME|nr:hypothetical protein E2986_14042 [Frieseomelitta varia]